MFPTFKRVVYQIGYFISHMDAKNVKTFSVCVLIATGLWLFNSLRKERAETIAYPITFEFDREKYIALDTLPRNIALSLKGSGWQLLRKMFHLRIQPIVLDITPEHQMKRPYLLRNELEKETQKALQHVRLEEVMLDTLDLAMDYRYKRVLRLAVDSIKLNLPKDFRIVSPISIYPELVAIVGPKKMVKALPNPYKLDMSQVKIREEKFNKIFQIDIRDIRPDLLAQDEKKVTISFQTARFVQKTATIGVNIVAPKQRFIPIQVNYIVRETEADAVELKDFVLEADWSEYKKKDGTIDVLLKSHPRQVRREDVFFIKRLKIE